MAALALMIQGAERMLADEAFAQKNGCFECHAIDKNVVGPAFREIARKYKGVTSARQTLIETVRNGGKGNWTAISRGVPMPPHRRLSEAEIQRLVDWVSGL